MVSECSRIAATCGAPGFQFSLDLVRKRAVIISRYAQESRNRALAGKALEPVDASWKRGLMANESKDQSVLGHIDGLVKEEERLYAQGELTDDDRGRLGRIKVELDQCWDLLRQRRALQEFGRDPDQAKVRPAKVVEDYEQ